MDHAPLHPSDNNGNSNNKHNNTVSMEGNSTTLPAWKIESTIANLILAAVTIVHIYFAFVVHTYAHYVGKSRHKHNSSSLHSSSSLRSSSPLHSSPRISTSNLALLKSENGSSSRHTTVEDDLESQEEIKYL
ncbi:6304_t:CDS:2 [Diversispora eburnea]|uniref:6304_t:CDS:1 n=1 Tax=Diversispora eburnea TaxID=1213867 RepID=A0A9N8UWJ9_9GLOM|nr:6304_t:CDS:2 [Diversispora eburnea]